MKEAIRTPEEMFAVVEGFPRWWKIKHRRYYHGNGVLEKEGAFFEGSFPVGRWKHFNEDGVLSEIKEIINVEGKPYLNQNWVFNQKGDTIDGSHYEIFFSKDTIAMDEAIQGLVNLRSPLFKGKNSSIMVIVPKDYSPNFNSDFSNLNEVDVDTTFNLNIESDYRKQTDLEGNYDKSVLFRRYYDTPGSKTFRGIIVEYTNKGIEEDKDSLVYKEHKKFFEKEIFVKDTAH